MLLLLGYTLTAGSSAGDLMRENTPKQREVNENTRGDYTIPSWAPCDSS